MQESVGNLLDSIKPKIDSFGTKPTVYSSDSIFHKERDGMVILFIWAIAF